MDYPTMQVSYSKCCICINNGCAAERKVIYIPRYGVSFCEEHIAEMHSLIKEKDIKAN